MRKCISFIVLMVLFLSTAGAQSKYFKRSEPKITYGVKAGLNLASQSSPENDGVFEVESLLLFNAGAYYSYRFSRNFIFQPELLISMKGTEWTDRYDNMKDIVTYIDLPLLFKYQPVRNFNVHLGPQPGYALKVLQKDLKTGISSDISYIYNDFDLGFVLGVETVIHDRLKASLRYVRGLVSATNDISYEYKCYNNFFQVALSYRLSDLNLR